MIIGIDLGTTNSLVSIWKDQQSILIPTQLGDYLTPSVVGLDDKGEIICGQPAKERLLTHPALTTASFKRYMGSEAQIYLGNKAFTPQELSSFILKSLVADVEAFCNEKVVEAVVTVPAYFNDTQRKMTQVAGELAGLKIERLLNEPTGAALAYGLHEKSEVQFLVFDLGGGTFDVSILELFDGIMEVRASAGDNQLGGDDFNQVLADYFIASIDDETKKQQALAIKRFYYRVFAMAEQTKQRLSIQHQVEMTVDFDHFKHTCLIDRKTFEEKVKSLIERLQKPVKKALRDSNIKVNTLDAVLLVGGASRMPLVAKLVTKMFARLPERNLDPDTVVALGAGIQSALKNKEQALKEVVLTDICPYTMGIEVVSSTHFDTDPRFQSTHNGIFSPIIERNTTVPVSKEATYYAVHNEQSFIELKIYQGESRAVKDNIFLGQLTVPLADQIGEKAVCVRFSYDINGLLEVEATVLATKEVHKVVITGGEGHLSEQDIQQSLEKLKTFKIHPRENTKNITLLYRANRLYEQNLAEKRQYIGMLIDEFQAALETQDEKIIAKVYQQINQQLDDFEI